jgi:hypothetical protein
MQDMTTPMADENLAKQILKTQESSTRKWSCPSDSAIASYVDGVLGGKQRSRLELHLKKCGHCRAIVGDTVKAQREPELFPPTALLNQGVEAVATRAVSRAWFLVPAGVVAIIIAIAAATIYLRRPEQVVLPLPHSDSAPVVAKSAAAPNAKSRVADVVRSLPTSNPALRITFPRAGSVVRNEPLQFRWIAMPGAGFYEVSVLASDGDLVWKGNTSELALAMPASSSLKDGSYFVLVTSYLPNGRTVKAAPISFVVKR